MTGIEAETIYGIDAAKRGWVVARASPDLRDVSLHLIPELEPLFWRVVRDDGLLAIDIPIGLPDSGPRACDREARRLLRRPRASSVFPAPVRPALHATSYEEACDLSFQTSGRKLSRQTYNVLPRLREVDSLLWVERQQRVFEAHPELSFMMLAGTAQGLASGKKTSAGKRERTEILRSCFPDCDLDHLIRETAGLAPLDDRLDALACLGTASRICTGSAVRLPGNRVEFDARSLRMEILA